MLPGYLRRPAPFSVLTCLVMLVSSGARAASPTNIFELPDRFRTYGALNQQAVQKLNQGDVAGGQKLLREAIQLLPDHPIGHFNLACALARVKNTEAALATLATAIKLGFNSAQHLQSNADLQRLSGDDRFAKLVDQTKTARPDPTALWLRPAKAAEIENGVALVMPDNTQFLPNRNALLTRFRLPEQPRSKEIIRGHDDIGLLLRAWYATRTAAGLHGILYDNHDRNHSSMNFADFPQLTRVKYGKQAQVIGKDYGYQVDLLFNLPTFGNSSTSYVKQPNWRSNPRMMMTHPVMAAMVYNQFIANHLYVYPEHTDYDQRYGDVFPGNLPCLITSQGSSGSDKPFLDAIACTLASFRPDVQKKLIQQGMLMAAVQMIFRRSNKQVKTTADYLTGKAHPVVFQADQINLVEMMRMAHNMQVVDLPPLIQLRSLPDAKADPRPAFFHEVPTDVLYETPMSIARVHRTPDYYQTLRIDASASRDINQRPLSWHWVVLQGDADRISINKLVPDGSQVEIKVGYHKRFKIAAGSPMYSNRVDIGAFVHNGSYYSLPGIVSVCSLNDELREYDEQNRIKSIDYTGAQGGKNYVDPVISRQKNWRDEYWYDSQGRLTGWTRFAAGRTPRRFTIQGHRVEQIDRQGRAVTARGVKYTSRIDGRGVGVLEYETTNELFRYDYASKLDQIGKVTKMTIE